MRFTFNKPKTVQLVGKLITLSGGQINKMKLIKLMYLIDREALIKWGEPVTGDRMVSMPYGPVLSTTLDLLNFGDGLMPETFDAEALWDRFITEKNHTVSLKEPIGEDEFSPAEIDLSSLAGATTIFQNGKTQTDHPKRSSLRKWWKSRAKPPPRSSDWLTKPRNMPKKRCCSKRRDAAFFLCPRPSLSSIFVQGSRF